MNECQNNTNFMARPRDVSEHTTCALDCIKSCIVIECDRAKME